MARTLVINADNTIGIQYLSIPDSSPVQYINGAAVSWSLQDTSGNVLGTGTFSAISNGSSEIQGAYNTTILASLTGSLKANNVYNLVQTAVACGFQSIWTDNYVAISAPSADLTYANRIDMEMIFGKTNIQIWADIDNDGDTQKIDARILYFLILSYNLVNAKLEGGIYRTPLQGSYPTIIYAQAVLATVKLYEGRGITNTTPEGEPIHQLETHKKEAFNTLNQIRAGIARIPGVLSQDIVGTNIPQSIRSSNRRSLYTGIYGDW